MNKDNIKGKGSAAYPCLDCKENHKCGIQCNSKHCFDENCGCTATEIVHGIYQCNVCKLVICCKTDNFWKYFSEISEWFDVFKEKNKTYWEQLEQQIHLGIPISEFNRAIYDRVDQFLRAKSDLLLTSSYMDPLNTVIRRRNAFSLIQAYHSIREISI